MTIYEELSRIQKELKAPKNQRNNFGGYNYRSCEDILEAVKPLLNGCVLTVSDEVIMLDKRFYVKATARLAISSDQYIENTAWAREPETKKGMDEAQITGATSSYARKYALNGLLAIDDTKDADATNTHDKSAKSDFAKDAAASKTAQTKALNKAIAEGNPDYEQPKPKKPLSERYEQSLDWLKKQTPESYKTATKAQIDYINNLCSELREKGSSGWLDNIMAELTRVSGINDSIPY